MIRDRYLTDIAYKRGYDRINVIERHVNMFRDHLNAQYEKAKYLQNTVADSLVDANYINLIEDYLNPHIDSLQKAYSDQIFINVDAFNAVELTRVDMRATQKNVPFPQMVPAFPVVTTDNRLNYGQKMKTTN